MKKILMYERGCAFIVSEKVLLKLKLVKIYDYFNNFIKIVSLFL